MVITIILPQPTLFTTIVREPSAMSLSAVDIVHITDNISAGCVLVTVPNIGQFKVSALSDANYGTINWQNDNYATLTTLVSAQLYTYSTGNSGQS